VTAFDEPSLLELSAAILERDPVPLQALRPDASEELEQVVLRCLNKNPDERFQNVADLAIALYPFAPRRARISVERCYHVLKNAGVVSTELELASAYPPPMSSNRVTSGAMPSSGRRMTTPGTSALIVEPPAAKPSGRGKVVVVAALGVAAVAGWFAFNAAKKPANASPPAVAAITKGATAPLEPTLPAKPSARVIDLDQDTPAGSGAAQPSSSSPRSTKAGKAPRGVRPLAPAAPGKRARAGEDELDPGF
ncbi:MAG TPA: hypothetical protein VEQ59_20080, partial [Polyangiaceae bacterium]|nr:hypothetical protein [Polyangiaceae bacterium]